jgi:hypothetical protein
MRRKIGSSVLSPSSHFAEATVSQNFKTYEPAFAEATADKGQAIDLSPPEAAGPKPEYLKYHRSAVFGK